MNSGNGVLSPAHGAINGARDSPRPRLSLIALLKRVGVGILYTMSTKQPIPSYASTRGKETRSPASIDANVEPFLIERQYGSATVFERSRADIEAFRHFEPILEIQYATKGFMRVSELF